MGQGGALSGSDTKSHAQRHQDLEHEHGGDAAISTNKFLESVRMRRFFQISSADQEQYECCSVIEALPITANTKSVPRQEEELGLGRVCRRVRSFRRTLR